MMKQWVVWAGLLAAVLPMAQAGACNWKTFARDSDHGAIERAVQRLATRFESDDFDRDDADMRLARMLSERARNALPLSVGVISGEWKVQSIQGGRGSVYVYPAFRVWIAQTASCGQFFEKYTGSQRRSGHLYPMPDGQAMAFVGTKTVNDDPTLDYAIHGDTQSNTVGKLVRLGPEELLLILDLESDEPSAPYELYYLHR